MTAGRSLEEPRWFQSGSSRGRARARFSAALLDAGFDRDEIGLVADAKMAEDVLAIAPGALTILPAVGTLWIAPTLAVDAADPPHLDLPLGCGRAFWLVRHCEALTA